MHFMDVYGKTTASSFVLLLAVGIIAATAPASGFVLTALSALSAYLLCNDVTHFGYRFFKLPKFVKDEVPTLKSEKTLTPSASMPEPSPDEKYPNLAATC